MVTLLSRQGFGMILIKTQSFYKPLRSCFDFNFIIIVVSVVYSRQFIYFLLWWMHWSRQLIQFEYLLLNTRAMVVLRRVRGINLRLYWIWVGPIFFFNIKSFSAFIKLLRFYGLSLLQYFQVLTLRILRHASISKVLLIISLMHQLLFSDLCFLNIFVELVLVILQIWFPFIDFNAPISENKFDQRYWNEREKNPNKHKGHGKCLSNLESCKNFFISVFKSLVVFIEIRALGVLHSDHWDYECEQDWCHRA